MRIDCREWLMQENGDQSSVLTILSIVAPDSLPRALSSRASRVHVPSSFTVHGCRGAQTGLTANLRGRASTVSKVQIAERLAAVRSTGRGGGTATRPD